MKKFFILPLAALVGLTIACDRNDTRESREEAREDAREAREDAREGARETGGAVERGAEDVAGRLPDDDRLDPTTKDQEQYTGTVTRFTAGQVLGIETATGDNQSFDLNEKGTKVNVPAGIKKGSKVTVTVNRSGNQKTINVTTQG